MIDTRITLLALSLVVTPPAFAADDAPSLPATAKKLTGARIVALYDGKTFPYTSYTSFGTASGTVTYDFKSGTNHGTYVFGSIHGNFDGKIRMAGDRFCYQVMNDREHCDFVYVAPDGIYNVSSTGKIDSVNQR